MVILLIVLYLIVALGVYLAVYEYASKEQDVTDSCPDWILALVVAALWPAFFSYSISVSNFK